MKTVLETVLLATVIAVIAGTWLAAVIAMVHFALKYW